MFIYLVTNRINGKQYIGQTTQSVESRWKGHLKKRPSRHLLGLAIEKYGSQNFDLRTLIQVGSKEDLNYYERGLISAFNTKAPHGYNLTDGGDGVPNPSNESRLKMSLSHLGHKPSEETLLKKSLALKGRKQSAEAVRKRAISLLGNKNGLGRVVSEETRRKISESNKGNKCALGAFRSPEYRQKLSEIFKGRVFTEETRKRMSEAAKRRTGRKRIQ